MADDKDAKDAQKEKDNHIKKELSNIAIAVKEIKPYASVIKFHLHDPDPTKAAEIQDPTTENKTLADELKKIDHPAGGGGPGALPEGPLSDNKLSALVNFDAMLESKQKEAFKEQFFGHRLPPVAAPGGIGPPDPGAFPANPDAGSILKMAQDTLKEVKKNATVEINRLIHAGDNVTPKEWSDAFQKPLKNFEADIDARIKILEDQKFADVAGAYAPATQREYEIEKQEQINLLKNFKAEFRKEVESLEKDKLFTAIKTAKFEDTRHAPVAGAAGGIGAVAPAVPHDLLNGGPDPNPNFHRNLQTHAEIQRMIKLKNKVSYIVERSHWNTDELVDVNQALRDGRYLVERATKRDYLTSRIEFEVKGNSIIIKGDPGNSRDIDTMLDAFYVKTGKENGILSVSKNADVSFKSLMRIAETLEQRRNPAPGRPPTKLRLDEDTVKNLTDPNGKHRFSEEQVALLGQKLMDDPTWTPTVSRPSQTR